MPNTIRTGSHMSKLKQAKGVTFLETQCTVAQRDVVALPSSLLKCDAKMDHWQLLVKKVPNI